MDGNQLMGGAIAVGAIVLFLLALWIAAIIEIATTPDDEFESGSRLTWLLVVILLGFIGLLIYGIAGRRRAPTGGHGEVRWDAETDTLVCPMPGCGFRTRSDRAARQHQRETALEAASVTVASATPALVQASDVPDQIRKLSELRDAGVLSNEEFEAKKAELLGRM